MKVALFSIPRTPVAVADPIQFLQGEVSEDVFFAAINGNGCYLFFDIHTQAGTFTVRGAAVDAFRAIE